MPQLHFYLPKELAERVRRAAEAAGLPVSRFIADLVKRKLDPDRYFDKSAGGWVGEPPERPDQGEFEFREPFDDGWS